MGKKKGTKFPPFDPKAAGQSTSSTQPRPTRGEQSQTSANQTRQPEGAGQQPQPSTQQFAVASTSRGVRQSRESQQLKGGLTQECQQFGGTVPPQQSQEFREGEQNRDQQFAGTIGSRRSQQFRKTKKPGGVDQFRDAWRGDSQRKPRPGQFNKGNDYERTETHQQNWRTQKTDTREQAPTEKGTSEAVPRPVKSSQQENVWTTQGQRSQEGASGAVRRPFKSSQQENVWTTQGQISQEGASGAVLRPFKSSQQENVWITQGQISQESTSGAVRRPFKSSQQENVWTMQGQRNQEGTSRVVPIRPVKNSQQQNVWNKQGQRRPGLARSSSEQLVETPISQPPESFLQKDTTSESRPSPAPLTSSKASTSEPAFTSSVNSQLVPNSPIKPGTKGSPIKISSNHLELHLGSLKQAYHYDVNILSEKMPKKLLRPVLEAFRKKHFPNRYPAFDGRKNIYASTPLSGNLNDVISDQIVLAMEDGRDVTFKVEIKYANTVDLTPLREVLKQQATPQEALQCVDVVLRSAPVVKFMSVGRSFFTKPKKMLNLEQGKEMYNGFYQSAIRGSKPLLNVDVVHKAFAKAIPVIEALMEVLTPYPDRPFRRDSLANELPGWQENVFNEFIKQLKITYKIPNQPATKRVYQVNELAKSAKRSQFTHDGRNVTVADYFETVKKYRLKYPNLPTLWVGKKDRNIFLPMELCVINEGQAAKGKLTPKQTSNMISHAATNTEVRQDKIMNNVHLSDYNNNPCVREEFGFSVGGEFQKLDARILEPPKLLYAGNKEQTPFKGTWTSCRFLNGVTIQKWTIAVATRYPPKPDELAKMARMLKDHALECGMKFLSDAEQPFTTIGEKFRDIKQYFITKKPKNYDVIFVVVPNNGDQYAYVKSAAELVVGCLTQCIKMATLKKMNPQTVKNILLKLNSKLNGKNHCFANKPKIMENPIMIMGADVTHPGPQSENIRSNPSVAAVIASHDPDGFQYNFCWRLQRPTAEIIEDLETIVVEHLMFYYQENNCKPEVIVFFRDGVSEGQFDQVRDEEIMAIRAACKRVRWEGYEPKITFLVVQKRHHTRFFPQNLDDCYGWGNNVPAGTCVDTTITNPWMQDFYLVSHASIRGVARPTKYCTLWDDNQMDNDQVQELAYYLCHMFTRCNRSVSYPAPTYYAHLAAARAKVYIANEKLDMEKLQEESKKYQIKNEIQKELPMFFV